MTQNSNSKKNDKPVKVIDKRFWAVKNIPPESVGVDAQPLDSKSLYPTYVSELEDKIKSLEKQLIELSSAYKNLKNDQQAFQQRMQKLKDNELNELKFKLFSSFIEIIDDLERALDSAKHTNNSSELAEGIKLIHSRMLQLLKLHNVEPIILENNTFDPKFCNAVSYELTDEESKDSTIAAILLNGYKFNDKILRPANVKIYKFIPSDCSKDKESEN